MAAHHRPEFDDLGGIDLSKLDLDHIELDIDQPPSRAGRAAAVLALLALGGFMLWLPSTDYYRSLGQASWLFFVVAIVSVVVGVTLGRWLWLWAEEAARRAAERPSSRAPEEQGPPSALRRWLTLLLVIGGASGILFGMPAAGQLHAGSVGDSTWFMAAVGAVVVGILLGRWLLMQSQAARAAQPEEHRQMTIRLPPWFKWVTLAVLAGAVLFVVLGPTLWGDAGGETMRFTLGGVGLAVGILGAIWVARRFDETEQRIRGRGSRKERASR